MHPTTSPAADATVHVFYARPEASGLTLSFMTEDTLAWARERGQLTPGILLHALDALDAVSTGSNYEHVASFDASSVRDLEDVWAAMQGEDFGVTRQLRVRSMMKGDVVVSGGDVWVVASSGFSRLDGVDAAAYLLRAVAPCIECPRSAREAS